jgi:hypothetical protein
MRVRHKNAMPQALEQCEDIVAAASSCPVPDCSSLVIDYRPADSVRPGRPEDWGIHASTNQTGIEMVFPDFLPITLSLIWR